MKYLLRGLRSTEVQLRIGRYQFYTYGDGTMAVREDHTGLMSPIAKINRAGLLRLLDWIDDEEARPRTP
jgi:hypothetical protein